jgi:hypothetical protein
MTQSAKRLVPAGYKLRVDGHLADHWSAWFGDLTLTNESDGTTSLSGPVSDQAELHGLLRKVRDLGLTLISVAVIDPSDSVDHEHPLVRLGKLPRWQIPSATSGSAADGDRDADPVSDGPCGESAQR